MCTKCGRHTKPDGSPYGDLRPDSIRRECEQSLRRLGVERIDLYQIHWPDVDTEAPLEDSWSTMADLIDEGKVRWIGVSNFTVDLLERCEAIRHVDSVQPPLSMVQRGALGDVIPWAAEHGTGAIVYSPMASGLLTGSFDRSRLDSLAEDDMRRNRPEYTEPALSKNLELVERLRGIADELGCEVAEVAIGWTLAQDGVTGAIVGARRPDQLDQWIGAGAVELSEDQLAEIDAAIAATGAGTERASHAPAPDPDLNLIVSASACRPRSRLRLRPGVRTPARHHDSRRPGGAGCGRRRGDGDPGGDAERAHLHHRAARRHPPRVRRPAGGQDRC